MFRIGQHDTLHFPCDNCTSKALNCLYNLVPHVYHFILPLKRMPFEMIQKSSQESIGKDSKYLKSNIVGGKSHISGNKFHCHQKSLSEEWTNIEKDTLKKNILLFGFGRWLKIRKSSKENS